MSAHIPPAGSPAPPDPGLDVSTLRGLLSQRRDLSAIQERIADHIDRHEGYLAFSGGKDSLVVLDLAREVAPDVPVVFFDSGLEYPETYRYIADLAETWDLNLEVIPARHNLLELLVASGSWDHHAATAPFKINLHELLIGEPSATAHDRHGPGELWGVRAQEARVRAITYARALNKAPCSCTPTCSPTARRARHGGAIHRIDGTCAYGPIWDWTTSEVLAHASRRRLPLNPVYAKLASLGAPTQAMRISHVLDGSLLERGRLVWLRRGWPALFEELAAVLPRMREFI